MMGCHVAAHDWAKWHLNHQPQPGATMCHLYGPSMSAYGHATSASVQTVRTAQSAIFFPI
jgi:hypothetical protein